MMKAIVSKSSLLFMLFSVSLCLCDEILGHGNNNADSFQVSRSCV
jgi:hypothetical protein